MMEMLNQFFASPVMQESLPPALLISVVTASMSVMVLAHRLSFLTVGVSHASLAGLGLAVTLSLPLLPTATVTALLITLLLANIPKKQGITDDAGIGMLFAGSMALGVVLISTASRYEVDLFGLLFGNILTISSSEMQWLLLVGALILGSMVLLARGWWSIAFDPTTAAAAGLPVPTMRMLLYGVIGLTVVMCVKLAGIVLTTGLLVLPAACAWFWGRSLAGLWSLSVIFSLTGTLIGLMVSYHRDWPSGATVVMALCCIFIISWGGAWLRQRVQKHKEQE
ncbi:MAG: metal ABC transporter permease [Mariprofundaceae bacterium]|nr:metal ABC transporter permease [Mariprofundaceae bacterium]